MGDVCPWTPARYPRTVGRTLPGIGRVILRPLVLRTVDLTGTKVEEIMEDPRTMPTSGKCMRSTKVKVKEKVVSTVGT